MARLFAKALNCEKGIGQQCNACSNCQAINEGNHPDVIEIDAASNNGVDQVRDLIDKVRYAPIKGRYKIYIIDEVHMDPRTEALLYAASRRQHLVEKVWPALKEGKIVLCDRFLDSSLAYQGGARGLGIDNVLAINMFATEGTYPDLTLLFDLEPEKGLQRIAENKGREVNRLDLEKLTFHKQVRAAFHVRRRLSDVE